MITLDDLRHFAVTRSLFPPTTLARAIDRLGFVQADPIRAPARAQDLTLRPRVKGYRAGDLERHYRRLPIEEDFFINYGFVTRTLHELMHPRTGLSPTAANRKAAALLAFVRERGRVHPRDVDAHFAHGSVTNYWGGSSSATTHLLEAMHYKGVLRVAGRAAGIRLYAAREAGADADNSGGNPFLGLPAAARRARVDALVDVVVAKYAPIPAASLSFIVGRLRYAVPHWQAEVRRALVRTRHRLARAEVDGQTWYWPEGEVIPTGDSPEAVRLLAPFDPVVWDRRRFELLWGWPYRFEAYTPEPKRKLGYYALPLLWRDYIVGWANVTFRGGEMAATLGYVAGRPPRDRAFKREIDAELERFKSFLDT